jgi:hypothetical protein
MHRFALVFVAVLLSAGPAFADPLPRSMRLEYTRAPGAERCPDEQSFRNVAEGQMSYPPFSPDASARLVVTLQRKGRLYQGRMELRDGAEAMLWERDMDAFADCRELIDFLALSAAVHLDPVPLPKPAPTPASSKLESTVEPAPPLVSAKPPAPVRPSTPVKPAVTVERSSSRLAGFAGAGIAVGFGVAPTTALGLTLNGGARWSFLSLALEGRAYLPAQGLSEGGTRVVSIAQYTGALVPCGHWRIAFGCGLVALGAQEGTFPATERTRSRVFAAGGLRVGVEIPIPIPMVKPLSLRLSGDVLLTPYASRFRVVDLPQWETPPVSGALGAGLFTVF